jgi:hypothetical protein
MKELSHDPKNGKEAFKRFFWLLGTVFSPLFSVLLFTNSDFTKLFGLFGNFDDSVISMITTSVVHDLEKFC